MPLVLTPGHLPTSDISRCKVEAWHSAILRQPLLYDPLDYARLLIKEEGHIFKFFHLEPGVFQNLTRIQFGWLSLNIFAGSVLQIQIITIIFQLIRW